MSTKITIKTVLQFLSLTVCGYLLIWILCIKLTGLSMSGNPSGEMVALMAAIVPFAIFIWWQRRKSSSSEERRPKTSWHTYWNYVFPCAAAFMAASATLENTFGSNTLLGIGNMIIFASAPVIIIGSFRTRKRMKNKI